VRGLHAYSHVNTFSSAAMTYAVSGDAKCLDGPRAAYDYFDETQLFATGVMVRESSWWQMMALWDDRWIMKEIPLRLCVARGRDSRWPDI
jgi:hypothetical protein